MRPSVLAPGTWLGLSGSKVSTRTLVGQAGIGSARPQNGYFQLDPKVMAEHASARLQ